jgi:hypothetical protein
MKKIHIFGTSFSIAGGFDFGEGHWLDETLNRIYKFVDEPKTIRNFSWPGQMERLITDSDVQIINHAKCGYGNELIYRKVFDITNAPDFKREDNLFLFEFSYYGRKEFYSKKLKDYFIVNYNNNDMENLSFGWDYQDFSRSKEKQERIMYLEHLRDISREFLDDTLYGVDTPEYLQDWPLIQNITYFVSYLNQNNINFLYTSPPVVHPRRVSPLIKSWFKDNVKRDETIRYTMGNGEEIVEGFVAFFNMPEHEKFRLHITGETRSIVRDMHLGLWGAKIVAQQTYNRLIDEGWIRGEYAEFPQKPILNLEEVES